MLSCEGMLKAPKAMQETVDSGPPPLKKRFKTQQTLRPSPLGTKACLSLSLNPFNEHQRKRNNHPLNNSQRKTTTHGKIGTNFEKTVRS